MTANEAPSAAMQLALVKQLFNAVVDLPPSAQAGVLRALTDDAQLIAQVESILAKSDSVIAATDNRLSALTTSGLDTADLRGHDDLSRYIDAVASQFSANNATEDIELSVGESVGVWHLQRKLGEGGMGSVFLVERNDGHFQQRAALKLLKGYASPRAARFLARERQILAGLTHPNIARLLDGGATPRGQPYLVIEYVEGKTIDEYCDTNALARHAIVRLFIVVCEAVAFAHRQLIVHCDLKPSNILVTHDGRPILLDFGVSRMLSDTSLEVGEEATVNVDEPVNPAASLTHAAFTPRYASPEQKARGHTDRIGTASDVYSLGLMLAELLKLNHPSERNKAPQYAAIIDMATAHEATKRYPSADALAEDLARTLSHQPLRARAPTAFYVAGLFMRRHWFGVTASTAFAITIAVLSFNGIQERNAARQAERAAREVKDYMISVFQGADPEISGQRDIPVSALLDAGRARLTTRLADQPETRAQMTGILGSVYQNIGQREVALKMFDEAITLARSQNRPLMLADMLYKKAYTLYDKEDFDAAEVMLNEIIRLREQHAPESVEMVDALRVLGVSVSYLSRQAEGYALLRRALKLSIKLKGEHSIETGNVHLALGRHHSWFDTGADNTEVHGRAARQIFAEKLGRDHFLYVDSLEVLGMSLAQSGRFDEGLALAKEMSEKRTKLYGEFSNQNGFGLFSYADVLSRAGQRLEAIQLYTRCIAIQERLDGRTTLATAIPIFYIANALATAGLYDKALIYANEALAIRQKLSPSDVEAIWHAEYHVGRIMRLQGRYAEAERIQEAVLKGRQNSAASTNWRLTESQFELAALKRQRRDFAGAAQMIAAIESGKSITTDKRRAAVMAEKARLLRAEGKLAEALTTFIDAEQLLNKANGIRHPDTWLLKLDRAELLAVMGRAAEARALARQISLNAKTAIAPDGKIAKQLARLEK
jgi:eukaryotic-like serine/threonine-protein kinase